MTKLIPAGFLVIESCEEYEQVLSLDTSKDKPPGGILTWSDQKSPRAYFKTRQAAREAIKRTEHYRLAFGLSGPPEARYCLVAPVSIVEAP